ncbi:MAG: AbrB/MazE/SpoVT family DNA-binding domain-containing protein [Candidatus Woesearchaeota archaeon]
MLTAKLKKWGNSYGILIPKDELTKMDLNEGQEVFIDIIKKENPLKDLFGFSKKNLKSTNQIIKEARDELRVD